VVTAAQVAAISWRDLDAKLAQLTADSGRELSHLRGEQPRLLTFSNGPLVIELEVSAADGTARLLGQLDPPQETEVRIESAAGPRITRADAQGRFSVTDLAAGWIRVVVVSAAGADARIATEWFRP
jgi:hypothetical protein